MSKPTPDPRLVEVYGCMIDWMTEAGYVRPGDENVHGTDVRAARGFMELALPLAEIERRKRELFEATFPSRYGGMILSKHNLTFGLCPHHLLPVIYRISLAYIPQDRVLGISKLSRLAKLLSRSPVLQEDLTQAIADALYVDLHAQGAAVYVEGLHLCMASRGVEVHEARGGTSEVRGVFMDEPATRSEFLDLVRSSHPALI